jgi:hypothetical protein
VTLYQKASSGIEGNSLDMDVSLITSDKGDDTKGYNGAIGYNPMFGFISDGKHKFFVKYVKSLQVYASSQSDQLTGIKRSNELPKSYGKKLIAVCIDSLVYMSDIVNYCDDENIHYTITAVQTSVVMKCVAFIPEEDWQTFYDREGVDLGLKIAEPIMSYAGVYEYPDLSLSARQEPQNS